MNRETLSARLKDKSGTVTVVVVLTMLVLIGFAAFAIDVGHMMVSRNQLQNIADTAALAAAGQLGANYGPMTYYQQIAYVPDAGALLAVAQSAANNTGISGVTIRSADFRLGKWDIATTPHTFTPAAIAPTAVNVTARKDDVANGPVTTLLAGVLGIDAFNVSATATASLTGLTTPPTGGLPLPVGISLHKFQSPYCDTPITLYPSNDINSCAGWNVYTDSKASDSEFRKIVGGLTNGTYISPATTAGQTNYNFTGGTLGMQAFLAVQTLFNAKKVLNDGEIDKDEDSNTWTTNVPVYDSADCSNPHGENLIVGFSTIKITHVGTPPDMTIYATILCDSVTSGPGGNPLGIPPFGTYPQLVQ